MASKHKYILATDGNNTVDIVDSLGKLLGQHNVGGTLSEGGASIQGTIAALAVWQPYHAIHLMNLNTFQVFFKYILPDGRDVRVALSKDTLTLGLGSSTGVYDYDDGDDDDPHVAMGVWHTCTMIIIIMMMMMMMMMILLLLLPLQATCSFSSATLMAATSRHMPSKHTAQASSVWR